VALAVANVLGELHSLNAACQRVFHHLPRGQCADLNPVLTFMKQPHAEHRL
jgi:hypothetical protein